MAGLGGFSVPLSVPPSGPLQVMRESNLNFGSAAVFRRLSPRLVQIVELCERDVAESPNCANIRPDI